MRVDFYQGLGGGGGCTWNCAEMADNTGIGQDILVALVLEFLNKVVDKSAVGRQSQKRLACSSFREH